MKRSALRLGDEDRREVVLLPRLLGRVFHVTCLTTTEVILEDGAIRPGSRKTADSPFGSTGHFMKHGCVSLFDYASPTEAEIEGSLKKCMPWQAEWECQRGIGIFFLGRAAWARLIRWDRWKRAAGNRIPHVEVGYRGKIPLGDIDELLRVYVKKSPGGDGILQGLDEATRRALVSGLCSSVAGAKGSAEGAPGCTIRPEVPNACGECGG